ncbi:hypothetical protein G7Z17_g9993 [Cylindrodendrum hubeiense]|uniref:Malate dehydrogenase n=1 Tax=Cylindrodendrum hubeiense TaxID=595255 RepID=A0A9P5LBN8_9HYPO|nr:hypothetical protein G7Z17_g9993 [Cylindrodendrum hubeiense]
MLANSLLFLASATLALASPCVRSSPVLPVNGGAKELATPPSNLTLKHIALGFGIQNYTCASAGATATATGALAMLYDIAHLYPGQSRIALDNADWLTLTADALDSQAVPLNLKTDGEPGADPVNPFTASTALTVNGLDLPFLGHHYFNAAGVPTFDLGSQIFFGTKLDSVAAPSSAYSGPDGTGAVAWLQLGDTGASVGISYVYRVLTAGGNAHTCTEAGNDSTSYTAQYWYYG